LICDDASPEAGDAFSPELNMFINSCLSKEARDRPTVAMLLQHPWFLCNSTVLTAWKQSRRGTAVALGDLIALSTDQDDVEETEGDEGEGEDVKPMTSARSTARSSDPPPPLTSARESQSRLSKLTQRTKSKPRNEMNEPHHSTAVCYGIGEHPLSGEDSQDGGEGRGGDEEDLMTAVRLEHLQRILEKTDHRYDQMVAMYRQEKELKQRQQQQQQQQQQRGGAGGEDGGYGKSLRVGDRSSFHSMMSSRSFLKAPSDPLVPLPNIYSQNGRRKWNHFARQLHLPSEVITHTASNIINKKYFAKDQEI
jgi:hypothetical protein